MASQNSDNGQDSKGPGCGCLSIRAAIAADIVASSFAIAQDPDFIGAESLRTMVIETQGA